MVLDYLGLDKNHMKPKSRVAGSYKLFAWEYVEAGSWLVPEFLRTDEERGVAFQLSEGTRRVLDLPIIPIR
jgi:hypothetical protein